MASSDHTTFDSATEEWRDVPGYEGLYRVSSAGRVERLRIIARNGKVLPAKLLKPRPHSGGYLRVQLGGVTPKDAYIHRLVAAAFLGECPLGHNVNHKDGNKQNNRVGNLEYCTFSENSLHAYQTGLHVPPKGEARPNSRLTEDDVREIRRLRSEGVSRSEIAERYGITDGGVYSIDTRRNWKHVE